MTLQVLWSPAGESMPDLGTKALVDVTDGDTPNLRMPVRMLSVDTPEVTAETPAGARRVDARFGELAGWIREGKAPVSRAFADHVLPRLDTGLAGTLQFEQGKKASTFLTERMAKRLTRPDGTRRSLFVRVTDPAFDDNTRLLAYVAPNFTEKERATLSRAERATFNLDVVSSGWGVSFVIYPAVPGELDLPLLVAAAETARADKQGIWADEATLPAYEYRALEKLHAVTKRIVGGADVPPRDRFGWRERYCADVRDRVLHGPEGYADVPPEYRLWIWPRDLNDAVARLNLVPARDLVNAG